MNRSEADRQQLIRAIHDKLTTFGGKIDDELYDMFPEREEKTGIRRRRGEGVEAGLFKDSGLKRNTRFGHPAIVWVVTDKPLTDDMIIPKIQRDKAEYRLIVGDSAYQLDEEELASEDAMVSMEPILRVKVVARTWPGDMGVAE